MTRLKADHRSPGAAPVHDLTDAALRLQPAGPAPTLHLLGRVWVSRGERELALSNKARALLVYLKLDGRPHHREQLARLLWPPVPRQAHRGRRASAGQGGLNNLRVELTRLRQQGIVLSPQRHPMLSAQLPSDLELLEQQGSRITEPHLSGWLLHGASPLDGLDDLGSDEFQRWLTQQRTLLQRRAGLLLPRLTGELGRAGSPLTGLARDLATTLTPAKDAAVLEADAPTNVRPAPAALRPAVSAPAPHDLLNTERNRLTDALAAAAELPQLVVLAGRAGSGKRQLIEDAARSGQWTMIGVNGALSPALLLGSLLHQLEQALPQEPAALAAPHDPEQHTLRLGERLVRGRHRLLLHLPLAAASAPQISAQLSFLLNLPVPLAVVLSIDTVSVSDALPVYPDFGLPQARQHQLMIGPLSVRQVQTALLDQRPQLGRAAAFQRASQIVQASEGWLPYAAALMAAGQRPAARLPLPPEVRHALLRLPALSGALREQLTVLSMVQGCFTLELARQLLGEDADAGVEAALQAGLLVACGPEEQLTYPWRSYSARDDAATLCFRSELLRSALAGTLLGGVRQQWRQRLAAVFLEADPARSLLYAEAAGLDEAARAARQRLALGGQTQTPVLEAASGCALKSVPGLERGAGANPGPLRADHQVQTPSGYRVTEGDGLVTVTRRGPLCWPPVLCLRGPDVEAGRWSLLARLDVYQPAPAVLRDRATYALGVQVGEGPTLVCGSAADPPRAHPQTHRRGPALPLGEWFMLTGESAGGPLTLSVAAVDLALSIAGLTCGGQTLLPLQTLLPAPRAATTPGGRMG